MDGAIHKAGGPASRAECRQIKGGCPTGKAVATTAGTLSAKQVIHAVGPVWNGGSSREEELLTSAYRSSLEVAAENGLRSLAFPSISTGAYRFPLDKAAGIAWKAILDYGQEHPNTFGLIRIVTFSEKDERAYTKALESGKPYSAHRENRNSH